MERRDFLKHMGCAGCIGFLQGCAMFEDGLRYRFGGELHRDFHASILDGYNYIRDTYGEAAIREVMGNFARGVHRSMHEKLAKGDASELLEFWRYYVGREGASGRGAFTVEETPEGGAVLTVSRCPALAYLKQREVAGGEGLCAATRMFNEELVKGTPFVLEMTCDGQSCRQVLTKERKRG